MIKSDVCLKAYNTFGIDASAKFFSEVSNEDEVRAVIENKAFTNNENLILGGGSNLLFTKNYEGIIVKNNISGIEVIKETKDSVYVKAGGGVVWHEFVLYCIKQGWSGIENLSLIPGSVGASPMQNIGAYGVEIKNIFEELEAINLMTGEIDYFNNSDCAFGYRESVFKKSLKGQYLISRVTYKLSKKSDFNTSYGAISQQLEAMNVNELSAKTISDAVVAIRKSKLPDPKKIGNSGSFFKNPIVPKAQFEDLKNKFPKIVGYPSGDNHIKLAAGWLIDQAGWKGKTINNYGVHKNQALVLVNYGGATGTEIYNLSEEIMQSINERFGVALEREVNIY